MYIFQSLITDEAIAVLRRRIPRVSEGVERSNLSVEVELVDMRRLDEARQRVLRRLLTLRLERV